MSSPTTKLNEFDQIFSDDELHEQIADYEQRLAEDRKRLRQLRAELKRRQAIELEDSA